MWDPPELINDFDPLTSLALEPDLNWVATVNGNNHNYRFGIVYAQPDPIFDSRRHCDGDIDRSGAVDIDDLLAIISLWGPCPACPPVCPGDLDPFFGDCVVNINDLLEVISAWGPCP